MNRNLVKFLFNRIENLEKNFCDCVSPASFVLYVVAYFISDGRKCLKPLFM